MYVDRSLVRHLAMRRTLFVLPTAALAVVQAACTDAIAAIERAKLVRQVEQSGIAADGARWLRDAEQATMRALAAAGEATGAQLSRAVPALQARYTVAKGKAWGGEVPALDPTTMGWRHRNHGSGPHLLPPRGSRPEAAPRPRPRIELRILDTDHGPGGDGAGSADR